MPIQNGTLGFNVGRDCTLVLIGPYGRVDLPNVTGFSSQQRTAAVNIDRLDGEQLDAQLPKGWSGSFSLERGSSSVDDLIAQMENDWLTNGNYQVGQLYQYVKEIGGGTSTYLFSNVTLRLDNAGTWRGDSSVNQGLSFTASQRSKVS